MQFYSRLAQIPPPWLYSRASSTLDARGAQCPLRWQQTRFHGAQAGCRHAPCMVAIDRANGSCQRRCSAPRQHPRRCLRQEEIADAKSCLADRCARRHASLGRYSSEAIVAEGVMATSAQPKPTMTCRRIGGRSLLGARHSRAVRVAAILPKLLGPRSGPDLGRSRLATTHWRGCVLRLAACV